MIFDFRGKYNKKFDKLYEAYKNFAYSIILSIIKDKEDTKDVLQESFTRIYLNINKFPDDVHSSGVKTLVSIIVKNIAIDHYRKNKKKTERETPFENIEMEDRRQTDLNEFKNIERYAQLLDDKYSSIIILRYYYGYKSREIGYLLSLSESCVRVRLYRAKKKLKSVLKNKKGVKYDKY